MAKDAITKKTTTNPTNPLLAALTPQLKKTIDGFLKLQPNLMCPRCQHKGTLEHVGNTTSKLPQPKFTCCGIYDIKTFYFV
jgi:hypothetical protein